MQRTSFSTPTVPHLPSRLIARRCVCGVCPGCREEARWERIFQEKFADPSYYARRPVRYASSLEAFDGYGHSTK